MRQLYPQDKMIILFDIDGTILDMRYTVLNVLHAYDRKHDTRFFQKLKVADINVHENQVDCLLRELQVPSQLHTDILDYYDKNAGHPSIYFSHTSPFQVSLRLSGGSSFNHTPL